MDGPTASFPYGTVSKVNAFVYRAPRIGGDTGSPSLCFARYFTNIFVRLAPATRLHQAKHRSSRTQILQLIHTYAAPNFFPSSEKSATVTLFGSSGKQHRSRDARCTGANPLKHNPTDIALPLHRGLGNIYRNTRGNTQKQKQLMPGEPLVHKLPRFDRNRASLFAR